MSKTETWNTDAQPKPLCCPRCGYSGPIEVIVDCAKIRVDEDGRCIGASTVDIHPNNSARCCYCKHHGTVQTFRAFPRAWNIFMQRTQRVIRTVMATTEEEAKRKALDDVFIYESLFERITPNIERVVELCKEEGSKATRLMLAPEDELKKAALALLKQKEELVRTWSPQYLRRFISAETLRLAQAVALVKNEPEV